ncbi:response regulator transcription factor [Salicibibacter cibarius]|uniref:Response regulator transcription factor n=1 Tax=Salicibibacter cibarius TaxID=2743000 RepID=A0A7T7CA59_9BACI|nr:LuxR C-terminal-related transcriptional regulator [Salicibibacter cibarius]QQK74567.1 response regulator transcription factor [Salicibibacter cibarius]
MQVYKRIDELTSEGIAILQMNESSIAKEWEKLLHRHIIKEGQVMQWDEETLKSHLETMIKCLKSQLLLGEKKNIEDDIDGKMILNQVIRTWRTQGVHIDKHEITFICHLLENATHKAIHTPDGSGITFRNHQAVHHFFTVLSQYLTPYRLDAINLKSYVNYLFSLPEFSVQFIVCARKEDSIFHVKDVLEKHGDAMDPGWLNMLQSIRTESIELLKKAVLRLMGSEDEATGKHAFITQEIGNELLLFYVPQKNISRTKSFLKLAFHMYGDIREAASNAENQINWNSMVALFYEWVMRGRRLEDAFEHIASGYVRYLPFERCALFLYLPKEKKGVGMTGYNLNVEDIKNITEHFSGASVVREFLEKMRTYRPIFIDDASDALPEYYINKFKLNSLVVSPIYSLSKKEFIGAVFLDQGEGQEFSVNDELMNVLVKMGHHVGEMLMQYQDSQYDNLQKTISSRLSPREIEVMNLVKNGRSISEISYALHLSQYTIRDYISSSIKKVNGRNRTHAVAIAIQQGFI